MFGNKHTYCKIRFNDEKTYWYRTNEYGYRAGMRVIVPVTDNGKWAIGTIVETTVYRAEAVPFPLVQTKGIVRKAGFFADAKISLHNDQIEASAYPPLDISRTEIQTQNGKVTYCTCAREREVLRKLKIINNWPYVLVENYPISAEWDIPPEARERMRQQIKRIDEYEKRLRELEFEREVEFEEEMEDLDQYN